MGGTTKYVLGAIVVIGIAIGAMFMVRGCSDDGSTDIVETTEITPESTPATLTDDTVEDTSADFQPPELDLVYFDFDRYSIRRDGAQAIDANASWLRQNPKAMVVLEGHCDERGTEEYNITLGDRRAAAVRHELVRRGIDRTRLRSISHGKSKPVAPRADSEGEHQLNRRVTFSVTNNG